MELESEHYDWVVIAQRISGLGKDEANRLLGNATKSLKVGGRLVVIDWVEMDGKPTLADRMASLRLLLETRCGAVRSPAELQVELRAVGLEECQFALLSKGKRRLDSLWEPSWHKRSCLLPCRGVFGVRRAGRTS